MIGTPEGLPYRCHAIDTSPERGYCTSPTRVRIRPCVIGATGTPSEVDSRDTSCARIAASRRLRSGLGSTPSSSASVRRARSEGAQRVTLPPSTVKRRHQLPPPPLAQRCLRDVRFQLAHELCRAPVASSVVDAVFDKRRLALGPARDFGDAGSGVGQIGWAAP